ncbi:MAG: hypothetical protein IH840_08545 [Candidatus Heimdallarchaeota archaeon]|nr:hypothetical protein [Candidatus Heimdallarchaeota archaeon]
MKDHSINVGLSEYCLSCDTLVVTPFHCGREMNIEEIDSEKNWICWKGRHEPCCGKEAFFLYEACCDNSNLVIKDSYSKVLSVKETKHSSE